LRCERYELVGAFDVDSNAGAAGEVAGGGGSGGTVPGRGGNSPRRKRARLPTIDASFFAFARE
jgi:hypothetical protein